MNCAIQAETNIATAKGIAEGVQKPEPNHPDARRGNQSGGEFLIYVVVRWMKMPTGR
jgi:hypothetical protein